MIPKNINKKIFKRISKVFPRDSSSNKGFALLYTVLIITLILNMALSISNVSYKQSILSNLANDSQVAFYQADSGAECLLYQDSTSSAFALGTAVSSTPASLTCGGQTLSRDDVNSVVDYIIYTSSASSGPCFSVSIDKRTIPTTIIQSRGLNICQSHPRQVERAVDVRY